MKVELKPAIARKNLKSLRKIKAKSVAKLKQAAKDTFGKTAVEQSERKILVSRKYPNWCDGEDTQYVNHTIATRTCFYPEDEKQMETMTREQRSRYKDHLLSSGRYYKGEPLPHEEYASVLRALGLDPEKYYTRDNA